MFFKKKKKIINIEGIINEDEIIRLESTLENLIDVSKVKVNLNKKQIIIKYDNTIDDILLTETIEKLGFVVTGIKE